MKKNGILLVIAILFFTTGYAQNDHFDFSQVSIAFGGSTLPENSNLNRTMLSSRMTYTSVNKEEDDMKTGYLVDMTTDFSNKFKMTAFTVDLGGSGTVILPNDVTFFMGLSLLSMNFTIYHDHPLGSSLNLGFHHNKIFMDSRLVFWNWAKGRDPVFVQDSRIAINYILLPWLSVGAHITSYAKNTTYYSVKAAFLIGE